MSDEYKAERVFAVTGGAEFGQNPPMPRRRAYRAYGNSGGGSSTYDEHDIASIFGLPVGALAPEMLKTMQKLLADANDLRVQLDAAQHHRRLLEDHADMYPGLPCLNAHAFIRELDAFLSEASGQFAEEWGQVAVLHVDGIESAVGRFGVALGDDVVRQVWDVLHRTAQKGEPLAYLGFGSFCWLLIGPEAERRLNSVQDYLRQSPPQWNGMAIELNVSAGLAPLLVDQGADRALSNADRNRLQLRLSWSSDTVCE